MITGASSYRGGGGGGGVLYSEREREGQRVGVSFSYFHTMAFSPLLYFAFPLIVITLTPLVLGGIGTRTSIF